MAETQTISTPAAAAAEGVPQKGALKKSLSLFNFFTIGFGATIGTGWVLLVGDWIITGGGPIPAMLAFLLGAVFLLPMSMCFGELGAAIPVAGGTVEYVDMAFGNAMSYITGWFIVLGKAILCPWEALAISILVTDRFGDLFPVLRAIKLYTIMGSDVYLWPTLIALAVGIYVSILNFRGASSAAKLQSFLFIALCCAVVLAFVISWVHGGPQNLLPVFTQVEGAGNATEVDSMYMGVLSVLVVTPFFFSGFDTAPQQAEEAKEGTNMSLFAVAVGASLLAAAGFYVCSIYSFGTIVPWTEFVRNSVPALAVLKEVNFLFFIIMLVIATMGPMGPMNSCFSASGRILLAMGRKGQIPDKFAVIDSKKGTPVLANAILCAITLIGPFLGKNMLVPLTNVSSLAFIFSYTMVAFAGVSIRKTQPNLHRPFKAPLWVLIAGCFTGMLIIGLLIVPGSPASLVTVEWVIVLIWLSLGITFNVMARKSSEAPQLE